MVISKSIF